MKRFRSLTITIALAFLAVSILVLLVSTALQLLFNFQTQQKVIVNEQRLVAQNAADTVSSFVTEKFRVLDQAADVNNLADSPDRRTLVMNKLLGRNPPYRQLFLIDSKGIEVQKVSRLSGLENDPLDSFKNELLVETLAGKNYISPIYIDPATSEPLMLVAVPTKNILREPQGAFVAEINLKFMWDLVGSIQVGQHGLAYVVDKQGNLIAFSDVSRVLARENLSSLSEVAEFKTGILDKGGEISKGIQGTSVVSGFVPLGTPDWAVVVEVPLMEAYASVAQVLLYSLLVIVLSAVIAVVSGIYLARRITKGIIYLNNAVLAISQGNLDSYQGDLETYIQLTRSDKENEITQLNTSFHTMTEKLRELYGDMDKKVKEKTTALENQIAEVEKSKSAILNLLEDIEQEKKKVEGVVVVRTQELVAEKARLLASINALSFGFILVDSFDKIVLKNPVLSTILELKKDPETIHDISEALKTGDSKINIDITSSCKRCMELKQPVEFKEVSYGKKFLRIICSPILAETGPIGYIFLLEDISEAKVLERSRDEFFSIASHELRTPLTAIQGNASMLLDFYAEKIPDPDVRQMLQDISAAGARLIKIVNDFLEMSRIEQGRLSFDVKPFDILVLAREVVGELKPLAEKKQLTLILEEAAAPPNVAADRDRTKQVVTNLIANAINYSKHGGVTVRVEQLPAAMKVSVTDTGIGISEQNQTLLFRKFQQAGDTLARDVTQSTGLGLYISKRMIEAMGGVISLEKSAPGVGSTFVFTLPLVSEQQISSKPTAPEAKS